MNRLYFFCAALLLQVVVLFSCKEEVDTTETAGNAVGFSAADVASASRAAVLDIDGLKEPAGGFRVSAYSTDLGSWASAKDNAKPGFMYDQLVEWKTSPDRWEYSPVKYWPGKVDGANYGKVSFFAWSKNAESIASVSANTAAGAPKLTVTVPDAQANQKDLVTDVLIDETSQTTSGGVVPFAFSHVLSRIGFEARLKEQYLDATVKVTSLKVSYGDKAVKSKGTYTFGDTDDAEGTWALDATYMSSTVSDEVVTADVTLDNTASLTTTPLNGENAYLMLLPQTVGDGDVLLDVTWTVTATDDAVVTNVQTISLPAQTWVQGWAYDYELVVSLTAVTFGGVTVNKWDDDILFAPCTITYKANGGTGADVVEERITNITSYPLWNGHTFTSPAANHILDRWNTQADGSGVSYAAGATIKFPGDLTLYAQWAVPPVNCYMVALGGEVTFPVARAYVNDGLNNDTLRVDTLSDYTGAFTSAVVWDDSSVINGTPSVSGNGKSAKVTVNTNNVSGNAVVAVKKSGGDIVWSWHIWVTDYDGSVTYTNEYNTNNNGSSFVFMDRNLGATQAGLGSGASTGLFYQWGRKDPFQATGSVTTAATSSTIGTIVYTLRHPDEFITAGSSPYDWHYASRNNELWGHSGVKTIYDPCPWGWRVPKNSGMSAATSHWYGFTKDNVIGAFSQGYNWGTNALYPAAGCRSYSTGNFYNGGSHGYYWSASPYDSSGGKASGLDVYSGNVVQGYNDYHPYGFSVRCVKE